MRLEREDRERERENRAEAQLLHVFQSVWTGKAVITHLSP